MANRVAFAVNEDEITTNATEIMVKRDAFTVKRGRFTMNCRAITATRAVSSRTGSGSR
jgi:hypothetical protein